MNIELDVRSLSRSPAGKQLESSGRKRLDAMVWLHSQYAISGDLSLELELASATERTRIVVDSCRVAGATAVLLTNTITLDKYEGVESARLVVLANSGTLERVRIIESRVSPAKLAGI